VREQPRQPVVVDEALQDPRTLDAGGDRREQQPGAHRLYQELVGPRARGIHPGAGLALGGDAQHGQGGVALVLRMNLTRS